MFLFRHLLTTGAVIVAAEKTKMRSPNRLSALLAVLLALPWLPAAGSAQEPTAAVCEG